MDKKITLPGVVPIRTLAEKLGKTSPEIVGKLIQNGVMATINESVDYDTASIIADEYGFEVMQENETEEEISFEQTKERKIETRPPVVTIMGHVDHGKTKLLDAIRKTNVIESESGGITQHIGAYQASVELVDKSGKKSKKQITFIDTPGHEAFSMMRAQGANVTDIVILVVAADDGVKPQTIEAISHAKAAKVPIIVAINKIDKPDADPERAKRELSDQGLIPEEWGGKTPMIPVSAKDGTNLADLLEIIVLTADLADLESDINLPAKGIVIESKVQAGKGPVATILVQEGTLNVSDSVVFSDESAKIRILEDWTGKRIKSAGPSTPVLASGFKSVPPVGSIIKSAPNEKTARAIAEQVKKQRTVKGLSSGTGLAQASEQAKEGKIKELKIILRADVQGSLDAIKNSLAEITSEDIKIKIIAASVGSVTESDINLAVSSQAVVIAFKVIVPPNVRKLAEQSKIKISKYDIIYQLFDDIIAALEGMLEPEIVETRIGKMKILKVFLSEKGSGIFGGKVTSGEITPGTKIELFRDGEKTADLKTVAVKSGQTNVNKASQNEECGVSYSGSAKIKEGDSAEFIRVEEVLKSIKKKAA